MTRAHKAMVEKNLDLIFEFERYVSEHPAFAKRIPDDAILVFQVKGDPTFNKWSRHLGEKQAQGARKRILHITISKMGPVRSRISSLKLGQAA